jgi:thioredoxin reductase (NADPH)
MSQYLVERCEAHPKITIRINTRVTRAMGNGKLERIALQDRLSGESEEVPADALFILIGGEPTSSCAKGWLRRDDHGFLVTGPDVLAGGGRDGWWTLDREPYFLESSQPGVFFAGDVRHGSVKRVASAVGEGAMAAQLVQQYFAEKTAMTADRDNLSQRIRLRPRRVEPPRPPDATRRGSYGVLFRRLDEKFEAGLQPPEALPQSI